MWRNGTNTFISMTNYYPKSCPPAEINITVNIIHLCALMLQQLHVFPRSRLWQQGF